MALLEQVAEPLRSQKLAHLAMAEPHGTVYHVVEYRPFQKGLNFVRAPMGKDRFRVNTCTLP